MNLLRIPVFINWALIFSTAAATVYLGIRNAELESRYTALAVAAEASKMSGGTEGNSSMDSAALAQELRLLQAQVTAMQHDFDEWKKKAPPSHAAETGLLLRESAVRKKPPLTAATIEEATRQQREKNSAALGDYFQTETVDAEWSKQITGLIEKRFAESGEALMNSRLMATECRSTLCRIEVAHANLNEQSAFEFTLPMLLGAELPRTMMFTEQQPDGSVRQVIYLARKGSDFP